MKNIDQWRPSKFVYKNKKLRGSRDGKELSISSRLVGDLVASYYDAHLKHHVKGRLIDLGCGNVPFYQSYKDYATEVICADWAHSTHTNPHLDYVCDLNQPLPVPGNEFDTIILSDVLEHLSNPAQLWNEMFRILKHDGKVILNVPFLYKLHEIPYDYFRYTEFALKNFATASGFRIELLTPIGGAVETIADISAKVLVNIPLIGKPVASAVQAITALFLKTPWGKRLSAKTGRQFPTGYFMIAHKQL